MNHVFRLGLCTILLALASLTADCASAQQAGRAAPNAARAAAGPAAAARPPAGAADAAASGGWINVNSPFRKLAPGVMQEVTRDQKPEETIERHDITELLFLDETFNFAKDATFRHEVWMLDIKYKPVRMIWADLPGPDGRLDRKQIWYIVYQVTNPGMVLHSVPDMTEDKAENAASGDKPASPPFRLYKLEAVDKPVRFAPVLTLEVHNALRKDVEGSAKASVEQYIPMVLPAIRAREDKNREFLTSMEMPKKELKKGETVWGVATWQDVDPRNVWFSVYIEGLTNAYKFADDPAKYAAYKGKGMFREIRTKVLKLNFWRPGDEFTVRESQVRPGVPELQGGPPAKPAAEWVWWRTFPPGEKVVPPAN